MTAIISPFTKERHQAIPYPCKYRSETVPAAATQALTTLATLPASAERHQHELGLQTTLGIALMNTHGFAAPAVEQTYARARALCQDLGESPHLFAVLWGLRAFYNVRGEFDTAHALADQLLSLATKSEDPELLLEGHVAVGMSYFYRGNPVAARPHLERTAALYHPHRHNAHATQYGQDPGVVSLCHLGWVEWGLGYPETGLTKTQHSISLATDREHPFSLAYALCFAAAVHRERGEASRVYDYADAALTLAVAEGFVHFRAMGLVLRGWALTQQGQRDEGTAQMYEGLEVQRTIGAQIGRPYYLALLADALAGTDQNRSSAVVEEALALVEQTQESYYEAELYRLRGELRLGARVTETQSGISGAKLPRRKHTTAIVTQRGDHAEQDFEKALAIARRLHAKSLELRAATSLSRLWLQQKRIAAAHQLLADTYGWFTEGFNTKDLQEAKGVLDDLAALSPTL